MTTARAFAKINLGLVVGPMRGDGKHELLTVLQRVDLHDDVMLEPADDLAVHGFAGDTLVRAALTALARAGKVEPDWRVRIEKRIPVAAGLGGGSADAAAALRLANGLLSRPLDDDELHRVAAAIGSDVPFFLRDGPQLASGDGTELAAVELPSDYDVVLLVPNGESKRSTASVYESFDARDGAQGFDRRAAEFRDLLPSIRASRDLAELPLNDLASSPLAAELRRAGAFRADVTGAGPVVYGLFERADAAHSAASVLQGAGRTFVTRPI